LIFYTASLVARVTNERAVQQATGLTVKSSLLEEQNLRLFFISFSVQFFSSMVHCQMLLFTNSADFPRQ
jgi:hypothetical protein